jgi:hypothetical protein
MLYVNSDKASTGVAETDMHTNNEISPQAPVSIYWLEKQTRLCYMLYAIWFACLYNSACNNLAL